MFTLNGKTYNVPGAYGFLDIIQQAGGNLPDFNVGLIIGKSMKGTNYLASDKGSELMLAYDNPNDVARDYGYDDIYNNFKEAQSMGAGTIFVLNAQANTQCSGNLLNVAAPVLTAKASPKNYGVFGNDIKVGITEGASVEVFSSGTASAGASTSLTDSTKTWVAHAYIGAWVKITGGTGVGQTRKISENTTTQITVAAWTTNPDTTSTYEIVEALFSVVITPTKNEKMITKDFVSGGNYIYLNSTVGLTTGTILTLMSNDGEVEDEAEVLSIDTVFNSTANGYKVNLTSAITSSTLTLAKYARVFQPGTPITIEFAVGEWTLENIVLELNKRQSELIFSVYTAAVLAPDAQSALYMAGLNGAAKGINPPISEANFTKIAEGFPDWIKNFTILNKVNIRIINLISCDDAIHEIFADLAVEMRTKNKPIQIITGPDYLENDVLCVARAKALNSEEVVLCCNGINGKPPYLSTAPQIFGIILKYPVFHNLTRDKLNVASVEYEWTELQLDKLTKNGCLTISPLKTAYQVNQGINTYQDHAHEWNQADKKTYLIQQRQLADFFHIGYMEAIDEDIVGVDSLSLTDVTAYANKTAQKYQDNGYITSYTIKSITKVELGWLIKTEVTLPDVTDFIGLENYIKTGV